MDSKNGKNKTRNSCFQIKKRRESLEKTGEMENDKMIKQQPKTEIIEISKKSINQFETIENRRGIRIGQMTNLYNDLVTGQKFKQPIHANKVERKYRIVDGNHRFEAIKKFVQKTDNKIKIKFEVYENLTNAQETELYDILAKTINQTLNDYLKLHFNEITIFHKIDDQFPIDVSIYSTKKSILFSHLARFWLNKDRAEYLLLKKEEILRGLIELDEIDYATMTAFFSRYKKYFGTPEASSPYYKPGVVWIIGTIYFRNNEFCHKDKLWELIYKKLFGNFIILDIVKFGSGRELLNDRRRLLVEKLNKGWRGTKLI